MKQYVIRIGALLLLLLSTLSAMAGRTIPIQSKKYVCDICVFATDTWEWTWAATPIIDYIDNVLGEDWTCAFEETIPGNMNDGGDYRVFVLYKTTNNPKEAITDIMVVSCPPGNYDYAGDQHKTITYDGKTYRAARYSTASEKDKVSSGSTDSGGGNLNRGTGQDTRNLYLYYTKDGNVNARNAIVSGESIISGLTVETKGSAASDNNYIKCFNPSDQTLSNNADCNVSTGGDYIYIKKGIHTHSSCGPNLTTCSCDYTADDFSAPVMVDGVYQIDNLSNLCYLRDSVNSGALGTNIRARLNADIDMTNIKNTRDGRWEPIGALSAPWNGTLYGSGHAIRNLATNNDSMAGLFGAASGKIERLTFSAANISSNGACAAGLVALAVGDMVIDSCTVAGIISSNNSGAAGFANVGDNATLLTITRSVNEATVTAAYDNCGGFVSPLKDCAGVQRIAIDRCINRGTATYAFAQNPVGSLTNCLNLASGTAIIDDYSSPDKFTMKSVLNASCNKMVNQHDYVPIPEDYCYVCYDRETSDYEEGALYASQISSGEACYLMNRESSADDVVWRQQIGIDDYPTPIHDDDNTLRVVYTFDKNAYYCRHDNYTNYKYYAEDQMGGDHVYTYTLDAPGDNAMMVHLSCMICGNTWDRTATYVGETVIKQPTCDADGRKRVTYHLNNPERDFYVEEAIGHTDHAIDHYSTPTYLPLGGVENAIEQCSKCGEQTLVAHQPVVSETYGWEIRDVYDLVAYFETCVSCAKYDNAPSATLMADIDLADATHLFSRWLSTKQVRKWRGATFDGGGHTIKGLCFNESGNTGLFGQVYDGTIKHLTLEGTVLGGTSALLCSYAENSTFECDSIKGYVTGANGGAGLCYQAQHCTFTDCHNFATVEATGNALGGLVAVAEDGRIERCTNQATIDGRQSAYVGGLVGSYTGLFNLIDCGNYGAVFGRDRVGGLVGAFAVSEDDAAMKNASYLYNSLNAGQVTLTGESYEKGGLAGYCNLPAIEDVDIDLLVQNCYYKGSQILVGYSDSSIGVMSSDSKCSDAQLGSGEICYLLNGKHADASSVWHQTLGVQAYPYPYGLDLPEPTVCVNDTMLFVAPYATLDSLVIHPNAYGKDSYFHTAVPFTVKTLRYTREATVKKDCYATLYLPFSFADTRLKIMAYDHYDTATGLVYFDEITGATAPNVPYLVRQADDCDGDEVVLNITATDAQVALNPNEDVEFESTPDLATGFYGTYTPCTLYGSYGYYAFSAAYGDFRRANDNGNSIYPFRATFKVGPDSPMPALLGLMLMEGAAGGTSGLNIPVSTIVETGSDTTIYDLGGRVVGHSLRGLTPGIYVRDGKKLHVK